MNEEDEAKFRCEIAPIAVAPLPALQHEPAPAADVTAAGDGAEKVKPKLP